MQRNLGWWCRGVLAIAVAAIAGCSTFAIDYRPLTGPAPAAAGRVALQVRNSRPAERGGLTQGIGTIYDWSSGPEGRNSQYHGRAINTTSAAVIAQTVEAATADALAHAGISVHGGGPVLVATIHEYWFDGHPVHTTEIVVAYDLFDGAGRPLWHAQVRGYASATLLLGSALVNTFREALHQTASQASDAFRSSPFVTSLQSAS
jgi:hypothetical protein